MNSWDVVNSVMGYVSFTITGVRCETFLTEVMKNNLDIWAIKRIDAVTISAKTRSIIYKEIEHAASVSGVEITCRKFRGLPAFLTKYRFRYGIMAGAAIFVIVIAVLSLFIWDIDITGYSSVYERDRVLEVLEDNGFHVGSFTPAQDFQSLKRKIMIEFDTISGVTINIFGNKAYIEISAARIPPKKVSDGTICNLVAKTDGQLLIVEAYRGTPVVKVGQAVTKGQLLISGIYNSKIMGERLVHARGKVMARTLRKLSTYVPFDENVTDEENALLIARKKLDFSEGIEIKNITVEDKTERIEVSESGVLLEYAYIVIEDIGENLEIFTGE
ncbi:MAG: hypothetical protein DBX47_02115 [Clostridiales bacterium]|nr:MAG: hypothetical protein DBX47_02115 [Clostridiales bacterium]